MNSSGRVQGKTMLGKQSLWESAVPRVVSDSPCYCAKFGLRKKLKENGFSFRMGEWEHRSFLKYFMFLSSGAAGCFQLMPVTCSNCSARTFPAGRRLTDMTHLGSTTKTHRHTLKKFPSVPTWVSQQWMAFSSISFPLSKLFFWCKGL